MIGGAEWTFVYLVPSQFPPMKIEPLVISFTSVILLGKMLFIADFKRPGGLLNWLEKSCWLEKGAAGWNPPPPGPFGGKKIRHFAPTGMRPKGQNLVRNCKKESKKVISGWYGAIAPKFLEECSEKCPK